MPDCYVDLNGCPPFLHRAVKSWYLWQGVWLRELGRRPGDDQREPKCGPTEGRWTVEMISAVFESHRVGKPVKLPLEQRENALTLLE